MQRGTPDKRKQQLNVAMRFLMALNIRAVPGAIVLALAA
jgi:hypothetical protein